jgi:F0F1-type ATP synthase assembly protein I
MTAALLIGGLGGRWLDAQWGTHPWLMLVGLLIGVAICFREMIRLGRFTGAAPHGPHQRGDKP